MRRIVLFALGCCIALAGVGCDRLAQKDDSKNKVKLGSAEAPDKGKGNVKGIPSPVGGGVVTDDGLGQ